MPNLISGNDGIIFSAPVNIISTYLTNDGIHEPKSKLVGRLCPSTGPVTTGKAGSPHQ